MNSFVSVKFTPAGRTVSFLLPDLLADIAPGFVDPRSGQSLEQLWRVHAEHDVERRWVRGD